MGLFCYRCLTLVILVKPRDQGQCHIWFLPLRSEYDASWNYHCCVLVEVFLGSLFQMVKLVVYLVPHELLPPVPQLSLHSATSQSMD